MGKYFGVKELLVLSFTIIAIVLITLVNFQISYRNVRDAQRKTDIGGLQVALEKFKTDYGIYPTSINGRIAACLGESTIVRRKLRLFEKTIACEWGVDSFSEDPTDPNYPKLFKILPADPKTVEGRLYVYYSNNDHYQLYASFEGKGEIEYDKNIENKMFKCGNAICNAGRSDKGTPLDKPLAK